MPVRFALGSGSGLLIDLGGFAALVAARVPPFFANLASTALAITTVYLLVTRFAFRVPRTWRTYVAFFGWYAASALVVSAVVAFVSSGDPELAVIVKVCSVPVTFTSNFLFGRWLFTGGAERLMERLSGRGRVLGRPNDSAVSRLLARRGTRRWRAVVAGIITVCFLVVVLPLNLGVSFTVPADRRGALLAHLLEVAFAGALFLSALFVLRLGQALRLRSVRHRRWVAIAVAYLVVNLIVLGLVYPGYWVWDEFYVLDAAKTFSTSAWQGYLTTIFYTTGLFLGPSPIFILLLQLMLIALIAGYVVSLLMSRLRRPAIALLALVPLLSFPVLLNNQYPLRLTLYGYLLLLLVVRLGVVAGRRSAPQHAGFVGIAGLIAILAYWRTEGLPLLLLLPVAFVVAGLHRGFRTSFRWSASAAVLGILLVGVSSSITSATTAPAYQTTAVMNPLSTMIQSPLSSPNRDADLRVIDRVIDLSVLRRWPAWVETPALWNGGLRPDFAQHTDGFLPAVADLVVHNPGPFLDNRWRAFLAANSMQADWRPQVQNMGVYGTDPGVASQREHFGSTNFAVRPLDANLKSLVERRLLLWTADQRMLPIGQIVWNAAPQLLLSLLLGIAAAARRRWWWAMGAAVTLANASVVFLTEPASYFMYFFPAYLLGGALLTAAAAFALDGVLARSARPERESASNRRPSVTDRPSILLGIPAYNCAPQIGRVLGAIDPALLERLDAVVVIDNRSTDGTAQAAEAAGTALGEKFQVWRNAENFGLGGSHKVAFTHAIEHGFDHVAILHGDDQADAAELHRLLDRVAEADAAAVLGARFVRGSRRIGYSNARVIGNIAINAVFTVVTRRRTVDLGSGINLFRVADLADRRFVHFDDGITFNIDLLLDYFRKGSVLVYEPITWREEDQVSNARNLAVGRSALAKLRRWRLRRQAVQSTPRAYRFEVVA